MRLAVNPNRMELLRLRRRLVLAERGHKLLKDKLEEIMRRFLRLVRELYNLQEIVSLKLKKVFFSFVLVLFHQAPVDALTGFFRTVSSFSDSAFLFTIIFLYRCRRISLPEIIVSSSTKTGDTFCFVVA